MGARGHPGILGWISNGDRVAKSHPVRCCTRWMEPHCTYEQGETWVMSEEVQPVREKLSQEIGTCDWEPLPVHATSDKLIVVDSSIPLLDDAVVVAENDSAQVSSWIESGRLSKLTPAEQSELKDASGTFFQFVIVAPFVLAQRVLLDLQSD